MTKDKALSGGAAVGVVADNIIGNIIDAASNVDPLDLIDVCIIHEVFAHTNGYIVRLPSGASKFAVKAPASSSTPMGAREIGHLQIGDSVVCLFLPTFSYGFIIATSPPAQCDGRFILPDSLVMRSRVGFFEDQAHYSPYENTDNMLGNFSGGRPADTLPGDWGYINELGVAVWIGKLLTQMRASDVAKIEAFWGTDLVRIFGYNFQLFTAAREKTAFDDEGEYAEVERWTPYMWESLGAYEPGEVFTENKGDEGGLEQGQEKSRFEPKEDENQTMVFRGQTLRGYLGEGSRETISLLPTDASDISKRDDELKYRGILEASSTLDGTFAIRSAKQIILEKSLILPIPRQLLDPDDPSGDRAAGAGAGYKAAGYYGDGPDHEKKPFEWPESDYADQRVTLLWEYEEYLFGKFAFQVIDSHEKDWKAPDAEELKIDDSTENEIDPDLFSSPLLFDASKKLPKYGEVQIDQRTDYKVRYYQSRSCFHMLDDGSIVIEDGYGSQIIMSGGHIRFTCQGDIYAQPGRSFIGMAPRDFIARAGWCAELSAAKKDVRIKAENNLHLLAGDGTTGSILIESRSEEKPTKTNWTGVYGEDIESSGIIIKAEESGIDLWTKRLFGGVSKEIAGQVEFSAGAGKAVLDGAEVGIEATSQFGVLVGANRSQTSSPGQFVLGSSSAQLIATLDIVGDLGVWQGSKGSGMVECDNNVLTKGSVGAVGSMYCAGSMSANGMNSTSEHNGTSGGRAPNISARGGTAESFASVAKSTLYQQFEQETQDDAEEGAANQTVWDAVGFSFRKSVEQYKIADDFKIVEARWQQLYRVNGSTTTWDEPIVDAPDGTQTQPYPGYAAWEETDHYSYTDPSAAKNVDYTKGRAKKREDQTEASPEMKDAKLSAEYVINVQMT